jgi:16S rRNA (cytidine1402-2'-O)-methyltransferase
MLVRAAAAAGFEVIGDSRALRGDRGAVDRCAADGSFLFRGFLPARGAARRKRLQIACGVSRALWCSTSRRIASRDTSRIARGFGDERAAAVCARPPSCTRPLSRHACELAGARRSGCDFGRGEIVLLVAGAPQAAPRRGRRAPMAMAARWIACLKALMAELPLKQAARLAAQITEARDNEAYKRALSKKNPPRIKAISAYGAAPESARQSLCAQGTWRKVRAPSGTVPGNAWGARAHGKCNRKIPPKCRASGAGKGEMVR